MRTRLCAVLYRQKERHRMVGNAGLGCRMAALTNFTHRKEVIIYERYNVGQEISYCNNHESRRGAGIGGLTLSSALTSFGKDRELEVDIYEGYGEISEIGAGINFWPRGWSILKAIGLEQSLVQLLPQPPDGSMRPAFRVRKGDQAEGFHLQDLMVEGGPIRFHRVELQKALSMHSGARLHLSHRLVSYEEVGEEIHLHFDDGKTAICDFLIGMDGINSAVRKCILLKRGLGDSPSLNPVCSGYTAYRGLIPFEVLENQLPGHPALELPMLYFGKGKHVITYPVSHRRFINLVIITYSPSSEGSEYDGPPVVVCSREEVALIVYGWEDQVQALVRCVEKPTKWIIRYIKPLDSFGLGRVVIAGDAAHAMTPHLGAGAGRAIEDAYVLASLLTDHSCTRATLLKVSETYDQICCPRGVELMMNSSRSGTFSTISCSGFENVAEGDTDVPVEKLLDIFRQMGEMLSSFGKESAEEDRLRALELLRSTQCIV